MITYDTKNKPFIYSKIKHPKYKYELEVSYQTQTKLRLEYGIGGRFFSLNKDGKLSINRQYRWDGASGPTIDTKNTIRASCIHDVLYQLIRMGLLYPEYKEQADDELRIAMLNDGKKGWWNSFRAGYFYWAVRVFGGSSCKVDK